MYVISKSSLQTVWFHQCSIFAPFRPQDKCGSVPRASLGPQKSLKSVLENSLLVLSLAVKLNVNWNQAMRIKTLISLKMKKYGAGICKTQ